jgi:hypothetical protein
MKMRSILDFTGHDGVELLLAHVAVVVGVSASNQLLQLSFGDIIAEFRCNSFEVVEGDEASPLVVKERKDFVNVFSGFLVVYLFCKEIQPLLEINGSIAIGVKI